MNSSNIVFLALLMVINIQQSHQQSQQQQCILSDQLHTTIKRQKTGTTCEISYQYNSCPSSTTTNTGQQSTQQIILKSCTGYTCNFYLGGNCYYYSSQSYSVEKCLQQCCPTIVSMNNNDNNQEQQSNYSQQFQQCFQNQAITSPSSQSSSSLSATSKTLIIVCSIIGFILILIVTAFICCRQRINKFLNLKNNKINPIVKNISDTPKSSQNLATISDLESPQCYSTTTIMKQPQQQPCTICLNIFTDSITKCKHSFHVLCLASWVRKNQICPNCTSQEINPITVFCQCCKKPYIQIKMTKNISVDKFQRLLKKIQCKHCKGNR